MKLSGLKLFTGAKSGPDMSQLCNTRQSVWSRERDSAMLDRKTTKLGDKTTGKLATGFNSHRQIYIYSPPLSNHLHRAGAYGVPILQLFRPVRFDQGSRSRWFWLSVRIPRICGTQTNDWADIGIRLQIWEWEVLGACMLCGSALGKNPPGCHFFQRNCSPGFLGWIPALTSLEQPRGGVRTYGSPSNYWLR